MGFFKAEEGLKWNNILGCLVFLILVIGALIISYNVEPRSPPVYFEQKIITTLYQEVNVPVPYTKYSIQVENNNSIVFYCPTNIC